VDSSNVGGVRHRVNEESEPNALGFTNTLSSESKSSVPSSSKTPEPKKKKTKSKEQQVYESTLHKTEIRVKELLEAQSFADHKKDGNSTELRALFDKFCVVKGHSDLQMDGRQFTMDKHEWVECLISLNILKSSIIEKVAATF